MPAATIGLFTMAIVVVAIAYLISQLVGGNGDNALSPADTVATQAALRTQTPGSQEQTPPAGETTQPGVGGETPGAEETPTPDSESTPAATNTPPGNTGQRTHTIESGEFCGSIAEEYDITVDELIEANDMTLDDCRTLQIGDELIIP